MTEQMELLGGFDRCVEIVDFGPESFEGAITRPRTAIGSDGRKYVAKTDELDPVSGRPLTRYVVQEYLCGLLASVIRVPIPEMKLLRFHNQLWFGSLQMSTAMHRFRPDVVEKLSNLDDLYRIAVFDVWVHNLDRHAENLIVVSTNEGLRVVAIDHSHCPIHGPTPFYDVVSGSPSTAYPFLSNCLGSCLKERVILGRCIDEVSSVAIRTVQDCVDKSAELGWSDDEAKRLKEFLRIRAESLKDMFNECSEMIPALSARRL